MPDPLHSGSGCLIGHDDHSLLAPEAFARWLRPLLRGSLQIFLEGSAIDLREHFEIAHTNFQPEWR